MKSPMGRATVLFASLAIVVSACAGQGGSTAPSASAAASVAASPSAAASGAAFDWKAFSGTEITFLANQHPWTDGATKLVDKFTEETGIKVNLQPFSEDLYFDKMEQTIRSGGADVYFLPMDSTAFTQYSADLIEPLTPFIEDPAKTSPEYDFADFPEGFMGGVLYPPGDAAAQAYGIPISFEAYTLFYNKDLVKTVPATYADLIADAERITAEKGAEGISGSVMRGVRSDTIMDTLSGIVWNSFGAAEAPTPYGMWFDGAWDKPRLTDAGVCGGLTNYAKLLAAGPPNKYSIDWGDANTLFAQGKAAYFIDASLFGPGYEDPANSQVVGKVGYAVIPPVTAGGESFTGHWLWGLGIPKSAAQKDAAWYFVQWMTDKANTAEIGKSTGGAPRLSSYSDPGYTGSLNPEYIAAVNKAMATSRTTVVLKEGWKDGAFAIVDTELAIAEGKDPTAACAAGNDALKAAVNP
ncbi:MAG TPA: extracellular solute-binding protein [Candidatus Limnocylindrales bacterium]|nr:extracellular solute-binding protein [Candidatus Limnocylindrales bacterium]